MVTRDLSYWCEKFTNYIEDVTECVMLVISGLLIFFFGVFLLLVSPFVALLGASVRDVMDGACDVIFNNDTRWK